MYSITAITATITAIIAIDVAYSITAIIAIDVAYSITAITATGFALSIAEAGRAIVTATVPTAESTTVATSWLS